MCFGNQMHPVKSLRESLPSAPPWAAAAYCSHSCLIKLRILRELVRIMLVRLAKAERW